MERVICLEQKGCQTKLNGYVPPADFLLLPLLLSIARISLHPSYLLRRQLLLNQVVLHCMIMGFCRNISDRIAGFRLTYLHFLLQALSSRP